MVTGDSHEWQYLNIYDYHPTAEKVALKIMLKNPYQIQ